MTAFIGYSTKHGIPMEKKMIFKGTIIIKQEEEWFVATCLENNIASQGKTIDEAILNLKEAIALYYEDEEEINLSRSDQIYITTLEMAI
jgi:predicted RNase H-like HicB family nuclease